MERGASKTARGAMDVQQKRKAEAPLYRQLHQWLVQARHRQACVQNEEELLALQDRFLAGELSQQQMQAAVREVVSASIGAGIVAGAGPPAAPVDSSFWHYSTSEDNAWECFSTVRAESCEMFFRRQRMAGKGLLATYLFSIGLARAAQAHEFHFALLRRFSRQPGGLSAPEPVAAAEGLRVVRLSYAPADKAVLRRFEAVKTYIEGQQRPLHARVAAAVTALQSLQRYGMLPADRLAQSAKKAKAAKPRRRKRGKKAASSPPATARPAATGEETLSQPPHQHHQEHQQHQQEHQHQQEKVGTTAAAAATAESVARLPLPEPLEDRLDLDSPQYRARVALLSSEIRDLAGHIQGTLQKGEKERNHLLWHVQCVLQQVFPCARAFVFGSHASGFALPSSDIDMYFLHQEGICFADKRSRHHSRQGSASACKLTRLPILEQLGFVQNALRSMSWVKRAKVIRTAQMPIVRVETCLQALNGEAEDTHHRSADHLCPLCSTVDISSGQSPGHSHLMLSTLMQEQSQVFPDLRPLMLVTKQMLHERRMCNVFSGGISSFALSMLVLRYLQHRKQHPEQIAPMAKVTPTRSDRLPLTHLVDLSTDAEAQRKVAEFYRRGLAEWPRHDNAPLLYAPPVTGLGRPQSPKAGWMPLAPWAADDQYAAYHRQLADWPTHDAAHHFQWMRRMNAQNPSMPQPPQALQPPLPHTSSAPVPQPGQQDDIGDKLLGFLAFYGDHFDPARVGITIIGDGAFYQLSSSRLSRSPQPMTLDNPCWPNLNVAAASYDIKRVLHSMSEIHATLQDLLQAPSASEPRTILRRVIKAKWGNLSKDLLRTALASSSSSSSSPSSPSSATAAAAMATTTMAGKGQTS